MSDFDWTSALDQKNVVIAEVPDKTRPVLDVPDNIVALAQKSLDTKKRMSVTFRGNPKMAAEFEKLMRSAGHYTTPKAGMTVSRPDEGVVVFYRASTTPRGRKPGSAQNAAQSDGTATE
jgi:hypothetical protein